jgi:hypothetical protein
LAVLDRLQVLFGNARAVRDILDRQALRLTRCTQPCPDAWGRANLSRNLVFAAHLFSPAGDDHVDQSAVQ